MKTPPQPNPKLVPLDRVAKFIHQLTHDVRNGLSTIDLETAFIAEIATDEEVLAEVRKLRAMVSDTVKILRLVSQRFQPVTVHPITWSAVMVMEELCTHLQTEFPEEARTVEVESQFTTESLLVDLDQTLSAVMEVLRNAFQFRKEDARVKVIGTVIDGRAVIEVREASSAPDNPTPPEQWGAEALLSTRPGGYGLGLHQARQITEAQGGNLETSYTGEELVTHIFLPKEMETRIDHKKPAQLLGIHRPTLYSKR